MDAVKKLDGEVSKFLAELDHPLRKEIDLLRKIILDTHNGLTENIKWNGPNYLYDDMDRITLKIYPPKQVQLILHRGAKKMDQAHEKLITDESGILTWKENDRAFATFKTVEEIKKAEKGLHKIIKDWIEAS